MLQFIGETPAQAKVSASKIVALEIEMSKPRLNRVVKNAMGGAIQSNDNSRVTKNHTSNKLEHISTA
jgi:hypothetical protein